MVATATRAKADPTCVGAVDVARAALLEVEHDSAVGEHVGHVVEGERLVTHHFAASMPGYDGWHWAVTVTRAPRARLVTVNEVALLPGDGALLAAEWVPWQERLEPGDLRAGAVLPVAHDDERLVPGWADPDDSGARARAAKAEPGNDVGDLVLDLWLSRDRVLSVLGREKAAERWYTGAAGPTTSHAEAAQHQCITCGFAVPIAGTLGQVFAVCANENSPSDGQVVAADHGCGGHSRISPDQVSSPVPVAEIAHDSHDLEDFRS